MNKSPIQNIAGAATLALCGQGGFTIDPVTGEKYTGSGYLVGGATPYLALSERQTAGDIIELVSVWYTNFGSKAEYVGGWVNEGVLYIDGVTVLSDKDEAIALARMWQQLAVGHLDDEGEYDELALV